MSRTLQICLPARKTDAVLEDLEDIDGIAAITLQRGGALKPPGDVVAVHGTNEAQARVLEVLARHEVGAGGAVTTSEPQSLVSQATEREVDLETNEGSWPEMASLLRRETNLSSNYLTAMFFAGAVAAFGLWTNTVHLVVGAMVIAPGFEPIIRVPFGVLGREPRAWRLGLASTGAGYAVLAVGAAAAMALAPLLSPSDDGLADRPWVQFWSSVKPAGIAVALAASAAGAAIIAAQRSVLSAGVMIALALVPSASIAGMALIAGDFGLAARGLGRWAADAVCVVLAGGLVFFVKKRSDGRRGGSAKASAPL